MGAYTFPETLVVATPGQVVCWRARPVHGVGVVVGVAVTVGIVDAVGVLLGVSVGVAVGVSVGVAVGESVGVGLAHWPDRHVPVVSHWLPSGSGGSEQTPEAGLHVPAA